MKIVFDKHFEKQFGKLNKNFQKKFQQNLGLFINNSKNPILRDHSLKGNLIGMRAFSVSGDIRVIYKHIEKDHIKLLNIGSHNQVYR